MMTARSIALACACLGLVALVAISGCRRDFTTEADALRAQVMELERNIEQLERRNAELEGQLRRLQRVPEEVQEDVVGVTPQVTGISIGRLSSVRDRTGDGLPDTAIVYINPVDGRGRFTQMTGTLHVRAGYMPVDVDPIVLGEATLSPTEVRDAYRSGFMGTHYTVELPITWPETVDPDAPDRPEQISIRAVFTDGHTGQRHEAQQAVRIRWDERSPRRRSGRET